MTLQEKLNKLGKDKKPFLFIISYDLKNYELIPLEELSDTISYSLDENKPFKKHKHFIKKEPISFQDYDTKFTQLQKHIKEGNTYLTNLTAQTKLDTELSLKEIYNLANAKFKLYYQDKFVCFSPERFCQIKENTITTYPMKGTIDANILNAKKKILNDKKELAEHTMIVDLLRNDLSIVSKKVTVEKFRYIEKIQAGEKELLQISSKISGNLKKDWQNNLGDIITALLPAGSITGTPKRKTIQIINEIEKYKRDYFTGVFGVFDGNAFDSAVMIRFIEKQNNTLMYKSGGGITCDSDVYKEYQEMLDKVYIP